MKRRKEMRSSRRAFLRDATAATGGLVSVSAISLLTTLGCQSQPATNEHNVMGLSTHGEKDSNLMMAEGIPRQGMQNREHAKIYTVFFGTAPSRDDTDLEPITNDAIVRRLQEECDGVDFEVRDVTQGATIERDQRSEETAL